MIPITIKPVPLYYIVLTLTSVEDYTMFEQVEVASTLKLAIARYTSYFASPLKTSEHYFPQCYKAKEEDTPLLPLELFNEMYYSIPPAFPAKRYDIPNWNNLSRYQRYLLCYLRFQIVFFFVGPKEKNHVSKFNFYFKEVRDPFKGKEDLPKVLKKNRKDLEQVLDAYSIPSAIPSATKKLFCLPGILTPFGTTGAARKISIPARNADLQVGCTQVWVTKKYLFIFSNLMALLAIPIKKITREYFEAHLLPCILDYYKVPYAHLETEKTVARIKEEDIKMANRIFRKIQNFQNSPKNQ